jgi:iron only hydrogenase large subunit-like protein
MISKVKNPINSQVSNTMQTLRFTSSQERNKGVKSKMGPWQCWLDFNIRELIFDVLGTTNVILQVSDQDKCCLNHGFSLHYEFYDLALEISFLFTSDCTQVVERLMLASIVMVQVLDYFEYKRCFNNLN